MKFTTTHRYSLDLTKEPLHSFSGETYFPVILHLLVLTRMNRWVCKNSLKEFLTRLFLILDKPVQDTVDLFLEDNLLLQGQIADRAFQLSLEDLLCFTGFSRGELKFHCWGTLEEFLKEYQAINYDVWAEESMDGEEFSLGAVSDDWLLMTFAMNYDLYALSQLSLQFKPDLLQVEESEFEAANRFAEFLVDLTPEDFFTRFQDKEKKKLQSYSYAFTGHDTLFLDPEKLFYPNRLLKIIRIMTGSKHADYKKYVDAIKENKEFPESLQHYLSIIKMGIGVKYGLIHLSDSPEDFQDCFDPRLENGALSKILFQPGLATNKLFKKSSMISWLHLLP